jgi:hypothetical protein
VTRLRAILLPAVLGIVAVVAATAKGLYVSPDAVFYVGTARNWLGGQGFTPPPGVPPLAHFPPLFSVVLAAFGGDPLSTARVVNAVCLAGIVVLVGVVVRSRTGSVVAAVLAAAAVDLLALSASALSEPLFILLALAGLAVLAAHLERPRPALLAGAAVLVGAALLTRYVGVALVVAGVAGLAWRRRWWDAAVFGAVSMAPVVAWLALIDSSSDRSVVFHMFGADYLGQAARPFTRWLVPWPGPPVGLLLAVALVAGGVVLARRSPPPAPSGSPLPWLLVAFAVSYLALLLANRAFTDATGRLDARFLAPLHVVAIVLAVPWLLRLPRPAVLALVVAQIAGAVSWTVGGLGDDSVRRRGYNASALRESPVMAFDGEPLYTNSVDGVFFVTGRTAIPIPVTKDYLTGEPNLRYAEELAAVRGYVVYLDAVTFKRSFQPSRADLEAALPLEVVLSDAVGTVYRVR